VREVYMGSTLRFEEGRRISYVIDFVVRQTGLEPVATRSVNLPRTPEIESEQA
jgi:hypothetical protein